MDNTIANDMTDASVVRGAGVNDGMISIGRFMAQCFDADGNLKWEEEFPNALCDQGKKFLLDNGLAGTTTINSRMVVFTGGSVQTSTVYATPLYTEIQGAVCSARGTISWSAAAGTGTVSKATGATSFAIAAIGAATTITGAAIVAIANAVGNLLTVADTATSGAVTYAGGTFASGKSVSSGDTLNVTYTTNLT